MSTLQAILFFAGLAIIWVGGTLVAKRLTEGDKFEEETVEERLGHLEDRLYTHRRWWQTGIIVGGLALYVVVVGMFFIQDVNEDVKETVVKQEQERVEREEALAEERALNQCRFREFVSEFFDQLGNSQFNVGDIAELEGFDQLDPETVLFLNSLALAIEQQTLTIEEARAAYIDTFPTDQC